MADDSVVNNGNVVLIDPNSSNINPNIVNGIPQYQDMYIFAELTAIRRGRTVLVTTGGGQYTEEKTGLENPVTINLMGVNQDKDNPNYLNFTTNYYDGSTGNRVQYESFGITNINVKIDSSFVPQINIQFVDIRGLSFFNQENSPYRILFDFPPPIFKLTIKGYYGKSLEYQLHLVKFTSEFKAENGNFIIDAQFIALTYAPLTDVLFRYAVNFPLISGGTANPETNQPPRNTFELIMKLKNLLSASSSMLKTDADNQKYEIILNSIAQKTNAMSLLSFFSENELLKKFAQPFLVVKNNLTDDDIEDAKELVQLNSIYDYDTTIKESITDGTPTNINNRLYIVYVVGGVVNFTDEFPTSDTFRTNKLIEALDIYRNDLINRAFEIAGKTKAILENEIGNPHTFESNINISNTNDEKTKYVGLDITDYYVNLFKEKTELEKNKSTIMNDLNEKINNMILERLGMKPTIYNVFKIILDDVDTFFQTLRIASMKAENHHTQKYRTQIIADNYKDTEGETIYAFPLVIKRSFVCSDIKEERSAPIDISKRLPEPFPEMKLIEDFIDSFQKQRKMDDQFNAKLKQNDDGTYVWIPLSPIDSKLVSDNVETPYIGVDTSGGGSESQPINLSEDTRLTQILKILLPRFYVLSQSSVPDSFYKLNPSDGDKAYANLFSKSEAVNLSVSITNSEYSNNLKTLAENLNTGNNIQTLYSYIQKYLPELYSFNENDVPFFKISNFKNVYVDKNNERYKGMNLRAETLIEQTPTEGSEKPIDKFQKEVKQSKWQKFTRGTNPESMYGFTQENVIYIKDEKAKNPEKYSGINLETRMLAPISSINGVILTTDSTGKDINIENINKLVLSGNSGFGNLYTIKSSSTGGAGVIGNQSTLNRVSLTPDSKANDLQSFQNIPNIWINELSKHDDEIYDTIINYAGVGNTKFNSRLSALIFLSNFGFTLSPFNYYPNKLNSLIFDIPAAISVPAYLPAYIGALVGLEEGSDEYNDIYNFFVTGDGKNLSSRGYYIFADITDVNNSLSEEDKVEFQNAFELFYNNGAQGGIYWDVLTQVAKLYELVQSRVGAGDNKEDAYNNLLYPTENATYFQGTIRRLITNPDGSNQNIINYSQITFKTKNLPNQTGYVSLNILNADSNKKDVNDSYFKQFFLRLFQELNTIEDKLKKEEEEAKKLTGDEDIITQTYYSFKNINDKWLASPEKDVYGYPFNKRGRKLIDSFAFVDRGMNPIGNTIINPEILAQMLEDPNISVFSVLSQLLSLNGFEFFPLQNFMKFENYQWMDSFKIDTGKIGENEQSSAFVCMYVGGSSRYPTGIGKFGGGFVDDGIVDISVPGVQDFSSIGCNEPIPDEDNQVAGNIEFENVWRKVRAFRVKFGEQNQSMFTNIKIDSKEYPETNESIQILSRLAGDNKLQAPVPKGQNLYNLYENRSYKATVTGLGNAMIQPTQYFQLENVPLFNGAYIILSVEHSIEANKMVTTFSGTKLLKYPVPRVLNAASILGFDGGDTSQTSVNESSSNNIILGVGTASNPDQAKYNSMYTLKIQ